MPQIVIPMYGRNSALRIVNQKTLVAFFNFWDLDSGLEYKDWKLIESAKGKFVASPTGKPYEKEGKTVYPELVKTIYDNDKKEWNAEGNAFFKAVLAAAVNEYERQAGAAPEPKRSASGPVAKAPPAREDEPKLPFD